MASSAPHKILKQGPSTAPWRQDRVHDRFFRSKNGYSGRSRREPRREQGFRKNPSIRAPPHSIRSRSSWDRLRTECGGAHVWRKVEVERPLAMVLTLNRVSRAKTGVDPTRRRRCASSRKKSGAVPDFSARLPDPSHDSIPPP